MNARPCTIYADDVPGRLDDADESEVTTSVSRESRLGYSESGIQYLAFRVVLDFNLGFNNLNLDLDLDLASRMALADCSCTLMYDSCMLMYTHVCSCMAAHSHHNHITAKLHFDHFTITLRAHMYAT